VKGIHIPRLLELGLRKGMVKYFRESNTDSSNEGTVETVLSQHSCCLIYQGDHHEISWPGTTETGFENGSQLSSSLRNLTLFALQNGYTPGYSTSVPPTPAYSIDLSSSETP
jgi:hypothetical protein